MGHRPTTPWDFDPINVVPSLSGLFPEQLTEKLRAIDIQIRWNTRMMALSVPSFNVGCAGIVM